MGGTRISLASLAMLAVIGGATATDPVSSCAFDRPAMLGLDQAAFDQDLSNGGGGWRAVAAKPGCEEVAADLIRDYRSAHPDSPSPCSGTKGNCARLLATMVPLSR